MHLCLLTIYANHQQYICALNINESGGFAYLCFSHTHIRRLQLLTKAGSYGANFNSIRGYIPTSTSYTSHTPLSLIHRILCL
ncbi:hypothetical protein FKM82_014035 [Ascaphus truei]